MKNILRIAFSLFFIIFAGYGYSLGEGTAKKEELITIYKGEVKVITVDNPTRVVINNPNVADVTSISKDEMLIVAKEQGRTNLIWWDSLGEHAVSLEVFLENMSPVKERIDNLLKEMNLPGVSARKMDSEGKVLLLGIVKAAQDIERINVGLGSLKGKTINLVQVKEEETVVGINVQVLELSKDATNTLGFTWPGSVTITERGSVGIASAGTKWSTLFKVVNLSRDAFTWTLDALVQEGKARILSQPSLSCQSGKEAELLVGGEKPILTTSIAATTGALAVATNVSYKEFGIKLKIKPVVTEEKKIKLALNVEVSEVGTAETLGSSSSPTAKAYPLTKRSASTELFLNDGQTMAIGGLKKQKSEEDIRKTPFLGDVPILGLLFKKKTTRGGGGQGERGDVELFITLTPTIIKEGLKKEEAKPEAAPPTKEKPIEDKKKAKAPLALTLKEGVKKEEATAKEESKLKVSDAPEKTSPVSEYVSKISQQIRRNFVYPWAAQQANLEGSLKLGLRLYYTGQLLEVEIRESSGYAVLDENAVSIVKKIAPYPAFPAQMKQKELWIDLPVIYKIQ
ncbi:MAG: TonB family protein [Candidatus Omnitrophota bacterium]|nr:TonB family protein [Candidatus Omnitrophota bacterium]